MIKNLKKTKIRRIRRRFRSKKRIHGTAQRPRLVVYRSNRYIYAQLVDDERGYTMAAASSIKMNKKLNVETAREVGKEIAKIAVEKGIKKAVFDRNGYKYHGRVKALAEGAREGGIKI